MLNPTNLTLLSSAYTLYKLHPFIPYRFIWNNALLPLLKRQKQKDDRDDIDDDEYYGGELYEIVSYDSHLGIVTKIIVFEEPQFTFLGTEYIEHDEYKNEPVFL